MLTYKDRAFCDRRDCANMECPKNLKHIPDDLPEWMPVAFREITNCEKYEKDTKEDEQ